MVAAIVGATVLPAALIDPQGFVRSALAFPLGFSAIESPAGAGVLGGPLTDRGFLGYAGIGVVLATSAAAISWFVLTKRTLGLVDMLLLAAAGYTILFLMSPLSRAGYFVLPFVLVVLGIVGHLAVPRSPDVDQPTAFALAGKQVRL